MTVRWTVRAANDRSRDRAARVKSHHSHQKELTDRLVPFFFFTYSFWMDLNLRFSTLAVPQTDKLVPFYILLAKKQTP